MQKKLIFCLLVTFTIAMLLFSVGAVYKPIKRTVEIGPYLIDPCDISSLKLKGPNPSSDLYTWDKEEAKRLKWKDERGNQILELYTTEDYLVLKSKWWQLEEGDPNSLESYTFVNKHQISYVDALVRPNGKHYIRIELD